MTTDYKQGIVQTSPLGAMVAINTPITVYTRIGQRTMRIRKIHLFNHSAVNGTVEIGTGLAPLVQAIPAIAVVSGMDLWLEPDQIPGVEFDANITAQATMAIGVAPNDVEIQIDVEEYPGRR